MLFEQYIPCVEEVLHLGLAVGPLSDKKQRQRANVLLGCKLLVIVDAKFHVVNMFGPIKCLEVYTGTKECFLLC